VFEVARKAYEWPKRFGEVLREGSNKAGAEHRQFEAALKVRRKEFEQQIEQFVAKLAVVEGRSDIVKREVAVAEVSACHVLQQHLRALLVPTPPVAL
jgi:dynein heavy chain